jgi:hypothetical protein
LLAFQLPHNEIALVAPIPSPEVSEQQDEIIDVQALEPLIARPMKQRARSGVKHSGKEGHASVAWNRRKMSAFMSLFLKFGNEHRDQIRKQLEFKYPVDEQKIVGQTAREWLINAVQGDAEFLGGSMRESLQRLTHKEG